jgi:hypothetical protein
MLYENETGYIDALKDTWPALGRFPLEGKLMAPESMELDMLIGGMEGRSMGLTFQHARQARFPIEE